MVGRKDSGLRGTSLELLGLQEAQHSEAEKWLPTQLHPFPGFLPHDADCPTLLQVGPRMRWGPRGAGTHLHRRTLRYTKGLGSVGTQSVVFSCLGHASLVLSGDMDKVGQVCWVDTSPEGQGRMEVLLGSDTDLPMG